MAIDDIISCVMVVMEVVETVLSSSCRLCEVDDGDEALTDVGALESHDEVGGVGVVAIVAIPLECGPGWDCFPLI